MNTNECYQEALRTAVHLNNTGVALLEQGCYRQAMETLADAVSVMKLMTRGTGSQIEVNINGTIRNMVKRAEQRLVQPDVMITANCPIKGIVKVYSHWDQPDDALRLMNRINGKEGNSSSNHSVTTNENATEATDPVVVVGIRIDSIRNDIVVDWTIAPSDIIIPPKANDNDIKVKALIVVHNCAVAFRCACWVTLHPTEIRNLTALAIQQTVAVSTGLLMLAQSTSNAAELGDLEGVLLLATVLRSEMTFLTTTARLWRMDELAPACTRHHNNLVGIRRYVRMISSHVDVNCASAA